MPSFDRPSPWRRTENPVVSQRASPDQVPAQTKSARSRTRFIDDAVTTCLEGHIEQVVILGAGFDARAYRLYALEKGCRLRGRPPGYAAYQEGHAHSPWPLQPPGARWPRPHGLQPAPARAGHGRRRLPQLCTHTVSLGRRDQQLHGGCGRRHPSLVLDGCGRGPASDDRYHVTLATLNASHRLRTAVRVPATIELLALTARGGSPSTGCETPKGHRERGDTEKTMGNLCVSEPPWRASPRLAGRADFHHGLEGDAAPADHHNSASHIT